MNDHELCALVEQRSGFTLALLTQDQRRMDERTRHAVHHTFLKPLLAKADACWVYGMDKDSELWRSLKDMLQSEKGKYRLSLENDPVTGREHFWNACGGQRGTVVVAVPIAAFDPVALFGACSNPFVFTNYRSGHTLAALAFVQKKLAEQSHVFFCFPRNNGIEWVDFFAPSPIAQDLFSHALGNES